MVAGLGFEIVTVGGEYETVQEVPSLQGGQTLGVPYLSPLPLLRGVQEGGGLDLALDFVTASPNLVAAPPLVPDLPEPTALSYVEPPPYDICPGRAWPCAEAEAVARCESGDDLHAEPWENWWHRGPFQISYVHAPRYAVRGWDWATATDEQHIAIAHEIWQEQSWEPWLSSGACWR